MREKWHPPTGIREMALARACLRTNALNPEVVSLVTNEPRTVINVPRVYPVPLVTNDPRVATKETKVAVVSVTRGDFFNTKVINNREQP